MNNTRKKEKKKERGEKWRKRTQRPTCPNISRSEEIQKSEDKRRRRGNSVIDCNYLSPLYFLPKMGRCNFDGSWEKTPRVSPILRPSILSNLTLIKLAFSPLFSIFYNSCFTSNQTDPKVMLFYLC